MPSDAVGSPVRSLLSTAVIRDSRFDEMEFTRLWLVTLATYGVGDIVTTIALIWFSDSVTELNAFVLVAVESFGIPGFLALKLAGFGVGIGVCLVGAADDDWVLYYLPPGALSVIGAFATTYNIRLLIG